MPKFRSRVIELAMAGTKSTVICSNHDIIESEHITYVDQINYFNNIRLNDHMKKSVEYAVYDIKSNTYDLYASTFNNYIFHGVPTISMMANTDMLSRCVYSAGDVVAQNGLWAEVNLQIEESKRAMPCKEVMVIKGKGYIRYMARAALYLKPEVQAVVSLIEDKVYVYFRDGLNPSDYIPAGTWYDGYCEHGQFAATLNESTTKNLISCLVRELSQK